MSRKCDDFRNRRPSCLAIEWFGFLLFVCFFSKKRKVTEIFVCFQSGIAANRICTLSAQLHCRSFIFLLNFSLRSFLRPDLHPMDCNDIIVGMAKNCSFRMYDAYTRDKRSTPQPDTFWGGKDDLTSAVGMQVDGWTYLKWKRKLNTGTDSLKDSTSKNTEA